MDFDEMLQEIQNERNRMPSHPYREGTGYSQRVKEIFLEESTERVFDALSKEREKYKYSFIKKRKI